MARHASRSSGSDWCRGFGSGSIIFVILTLVGVIFAVEASTTHRTLASRNTGDTPISGFYGPGAWCAWLITIGMTHGHIGVALLKKGDLAAEWDYDLIAAGGYIITASIDLILKSRTIARLGEAASESAPCGTRRIHWHRILYIHRGHLPQCRGLWSP
jgi:hypothetical protein